MNHRKNILKSYQAGVAAVSGYSAVRKYLPMMLRDEQVHPKQKIRLISIGKAADAMLQAALECLVGQVDSALLITKTGHASRRLQNHPLVQYIESAHPIPDQSSLRAGQHLVDFCTLHKPSTIDVFLISGGTSSLVELLPESWTLQEFQSLTQWMLKNSLSIEQMNMIRGRISKLKQGQLWQFIKAQEIIGLMISDVPTNDCAVIGSGLLFAGKNKNLPKALPEHWRKKIPAYKNISINHFSYAIIADNQQALQAVAKKAVALGYLVIVRSEFLQGDSIEVAKYCCDLSQQYRHQLLIWGAETTVKLPEKIGRGGRCQHLALAAALYLQDNKSGETILLAGATDGGDGSSTDSGAMIDRQSISRMQHKGVDAKQGLNQANSGYCLEASGDVVSTGLTGTNVMDIVIAFSA